MVWMGVAAAGLVLLGSGCASEPRVSPAWEWQQMSERYPNPPPAEEQTFGRPETRAYWQ